MCHLSALNNCGLASASTLEIIKQKSNVQCITFIVLLYGGAYCFNFC